MKNFIQIGDIDVIPLLLQLERNPQLWNQHTDRTTRKELVHDVSDIWLRFRPHDQLKSDQNFLEPFWDMEWYPAYYKLPEIRPITQAMMQRVGGTALGGCLITRLEPGQQVKPHADIGGWHPAHYFTKIYIPLKANPYCVNMCDGEELVMGVGEVWTFDNLKLHSVTNTGDSDRVTLIISIRTE